MNDTTYKFEDTIGGKLIQAFEDEWLECVEYRGKSLSKWLSEYNKKIEKQREQLAKARHAAQKQSNLEAYKQQADASSQHDERGQFTDLSTDFDRGEVFVDEHDQYRAELKFASGIRLFENGEQ